MSKCNITRILGVALCENGGFDFSKLPFKFRHDTMTATTTVVFSFAIARQILMSVILIKNDVA